MPPPEYKETSQLQRLFEETEFLSVKHSSYFQVYEETIGRFVGKELTLLEIGVFNGGSLFMWRRYLGPRARIIGVDLNPMARKWEEFGFDIFIGDQGDEGFWESVFAQVGEVDIIIDDGGHTNRQQITTAYCAIPRIRDGGVMLIEDVHCSYFRAFGNPSRHSFVNFAKRMVDVVNSRFPGVKIPESNFRSLIWQVSFYESIVCLHIDRRKCVVPKWASNHGVDSGIQDVRLDAIDNPITSFLRWVVGDDDEPARKSFLGKRRAWVLQVVYFLSERADGLRLHKYFR